MMKILEMSYSTLNSLKEATELLIKDEDQKGLVKQNQDKKFLSLPESQDEWISYEFPQELVTRVDFL